MSDGHYFVKGNQFAELTASPNGYALREGVVGSQGETIFKTYYDLASAQRSYDQDVERLKSTGFRRSRGKPVALTVLPRPPRFQSKGIVFEDGVTFFELVATPAMHTLRKGALGTPGTTTTQKFASATESFEAYKAAIGLPGFRMAGGDVPYALVAAAKREAARPAKRAKPAPAATVARDPKLEAAIEADLDRSDAYLVYADWLQSKGDPRGELIVLQHRKQTAAATRLLQAHASHFFGPLAAHQDLLAPIKSHDVRGRPTTWRWGFLESVFIGNKDGVDEAAFDDALGALLDHPSARFLRELTIGIRSTSSENSYATVAKVIGKRKLPTLKTLFIGDFSSDETELGWSEMGNVEPLYKAVPNLESLTLRSGSIKLGKLALPKLKELRIVTDGLDKTSLAAITGQKWPALETLSLQLGDTVSPAVKLAHLAPIFAGSNFPKCTHLGLGKADFADDIARQLATSKLAARLVHLDLSEGTLGDAGALALAAGSWPELVSIDVHESWLTKRGITALKSIAKTVLAAGQQNDDGDPDNRYLSGNE